MRRALTLLAIVTLALAGCDGGSDEPVVESDGLAVPSETETEAATAAPSPVATATEEPTPDETATEPAPTPRTFEEVCEGRDSEAFIEVLTPAADAEVGDPFTFTGCGNTFEANYVFRVETPEGEVLVEDFGTMSCGNGCVGEFEQEVTVGTTGDVVLVVFESSAEDGSEEHVVEVPLTIG